VAEDVAARSGLQPVWLIGDPPHANHPKIKTEVKRLLTQPLTETSAIQIALLNNPSLQAHYSALGVAQADLVQAGLIANPLLGGIVALPIGSGTTDLTFNLTFNFLNILTRSLREKLAESEFEETRLKMVKVTIDLVSQVRIAIYEAVAAKGLKDLSDERVVVATAQYETSKALRAAGNIPELDLMLSRIDYEQVRLENNRAETHLHQARAKLALILGVKGDETPLYFDKRLPIPSYKLLQEDEGYLTDILDKNLDLALLKQHLETLCHSYQITDMKALIPDLTIGGEVARDEGDWQLGPTLTYALPIFDQGQAAKAKAQFEIRGLQERYKHMEIQIRTTFSILRGRLKSLRHQIHRMQKSVLPLHQKASDETLRHYNAMNRGIMDLMSMKQKQIEAHKNYDDILLEYWVTKSQLDQLRQGSLPPVLMSSGENP
jgi:cobalt-zinc-cadmium efflux system outer membrane protein